MNDEQPTTSTETSASDGTVRFTVVTKTSTSWDEPAPQPEPEAEPAADVQA